MSLVLAVLVKATSTEAGTELLREHHHSGSYRSSPSAQLRGSDEAALHKAMLRDERSVSDGGLLLSDYRALIQNGNLNSSRLKMPVCAIKQAVFHQIGPSAVTLAVCAQEDFVAC